jgi:Protein of unknown function (DUF4019)
MKFISGLIIAGALLAMLPAHAQDADKVTHAEAAALAWLALTDAGDFAGSWDQAAGSFEASVSKPEWISAAANVRPPLGKLISRTLKSAKYTRSLPGAPEGDYVIIQYDSQFEHKAAAVETIVPSMDKDGTWKVSGYFIK